MAAKKFQWPNWISLNDVVFSGYLEDFNIFQNFMLQINENIELFEKNFYQWFNGHNNFPDPSDIRAKVLFLSAPNDVQNMVFLNLKDICKANQAIIARSDNLVLKICGSPREAFNYVRTHATIHTRKFLKPHYIGPGFYDNKLVFVIVMEMGTDISLTASEKFSEHLLDIMHKEPHIIIFDLNPKNFLNFSEKSFFIDLDIMFHLSSDWKEIMPILASTIEIEFFTEGLSMPLHLILFGLPHLWQFKDGFNMSLLLCQCLSIFWFRFVLIENCEAFLSLLGIPGKDLSSIAEINEKQKNDIYIFQLIQLINPNCEFFFGSRFPAFGQFIAEVIKCFSLTSIPKPQEIVSVAKNIYKQNRHDYSNGFKAICPTPIVNGPKLRGKPGSAVLPFMATTSELILTFGTEPVVALIYLYQILDEVKKNEVFLIIPCQPKNVSTVPLTSLEFLHINLPIAQSKRFIYENISRPEKYFKLKNIITTVLVTKEKISSQQVGFISDELAQKCGFAKSFLCQSISLDFLGNHNFWNIGEIIF